MKSLTAQEKAEKIISTLTEQEKTRIIYLETAMKAWTGLIINIKCELSYIPTDQETIKERFKCSVPQFFKDLDLTYEPLFSVYFRTRDLKSGAVLILRNDNLYGSLEVYHNLETELIKKDSPEFELVNNLMYYLD